jgi:hypothetical protein
LLHTCANSTGLWFRFLSLSPSGLPLESFPFSQKSGFCTKRSLRTSLEFLA